MTTELGEDDRRGDGRGNEMVVRNSMERKEKTDALKKMMSGKAAGLVVL